MKYYIQTTVSLKFGQNQKYYEMMGKFVPFMAKHGWKMIFGLQPVVGDLSQLTHLWEIERFEDIERALHACRNEPEAHALLANIPDFTLNEAIQIMTKTPYSP